MRGKFHFFPFNVHINFASSIIYNIKYIYIYVSVTFGIVESIHSTTIISMLLVRNKVINFEKAFYYFK